MTNSPQFYLGVACKEHVEHGLKLGIAQFCHGKISPAQRLKKGDYIVYYSPKISMENKTPYQKFTALGQVKDNGVYQVDMGNDFKPYRRNIDYAHVRHVDIRPLIADLAFIKNKLSWGYTFRYGFIKIDAESFDVIRRAMLI